MSDERVVVLLVEDNHDVGAALARYLVGHGFAVFVAANGGTAAELVSTIQIDVLLVDYVLPDMDGATLVIGLRRRLARHIPAVCLTGLNLPEHHRAAFDIIMTKPPESFAHVAKAIREVMQ